jgi:hypothetical protein
MPSYYETVASGGDSCEPEQAFVHLYPQESVDQTCQVSGIVKSAMEAAFDDLISFGAIDYYEVLRFKSEENNYPNGVRVGDDSSPTESDFKDFLRYENGTGDDLYTRGGTHQLIHADQNACDEASEGYAPAGANAEGKSQTAFTKPLVAWSPVCDFDESLTECAAVQEALHTFIDHDENDPYTGDNDDEHSLGRVIEVYGTGYATPLIAYHWDDQFDTVGKGECPSDDPDNRYASDHVNTPTDCTKKAIRDTADKELDDSISFC